MTRILCVALALLALNVVAGSDVSAQSAFPPVGARSPSPTPQQSPFPPVRQPIAIPGASPLSQPPASVDCVSSVDPLREEAQKKAAIVREAGRRHALPGEACKLIGEFHAAEAKYIGYVEINAARCGIPTQAVDQLRTNHKAHDATWIKVCTAAGQGKQFAPVLPVGDFWPAGAVDVLLLTKNGRSSILPPLPNRGNPRANVLEEQ